MSGFHVSKVVIIESLLDSDWKTGVEIEKVMLHEFAEHGLSVSVERHSIRRADEFALIIELLIRTGNTDPPLLHIETHGDKWDGLIFADGSELSWTEVGRLLAPLNEATGFNLVCVFAACYGAFLSRVLYVTHASPCFALIGPMDELDPGEVHRAFRKLYHDFAVTRDMGIALQRLVQEVPIRGGWFRMRMDRWFLKIMRKFAEESASAEAMMRNAQSLLRYINSPLKFGLSPDDVGDNFNYHSSGNLTFEQMQMLVKLKTHHYLSSLAFNRFFMVDSIPSNRDRFSDVENEIQEKFLPLFDK